MRKIVMFTADLVAAALLVTGIWGINYLLPQTGIQAHAMTESLSGGGAAQQDSTAPTLPGVINPWDTETTLPGTRTSAPDISAQSGSADKAAEILTDMSQRMQSVLAVNGDSYSNSRHKNNGTIIRNGVVYRARPTDMETCVLNWDGTMKIYSPQELDTQQLIDSGAFQSWVLGPSLLDENGKAKTEFLTWDYIRESHPRTAIGYYEPGHYCLLVVDGRQQDSRGMFLDEMASLFEQLGCTAAYNLDGGHCSFMTMGSWIANHPYKPEHTVEDGIFIGEAL